MEQEGGERCDGGLQLMISSVSNECNLYFCGTSLGYGESF